MARTSFSSSTPVGPKFERLRQYERRSQARNRRRFEYLEKTIREYEIAGMLVQSEANNAVRRAVEENRHLRNLLARQGMTALSVEGYLASETVTGQQPANQMPSQTNIALSGPASEAITDGRSINNTTPPAGASQSLLHSPQQRPNAGAAAGPSATTEPVSVSS